MPYAINERNGMRAVDPETDLLPGETYYEALPVPWPPVEPEEPVENLS